MCLLGNNKNALIKAMNAIICDEVADDSDDKLQKHSDKYDRESSHLGRGYRHR